MIQCNDIFKSYGSLEVLRGVDLHVQKGDMVAIVGRSGAGKSTLLHILGTLDRPDSGTLSIGNQTTAGMSERALADFRNRNIGFVFQFHHLLPEFTALENVCIPGFIAKRSEREVRDRAKELLDYLGLGGRMEHKPTELSGGEQQRVAVARALINNPAVVFADEPTGNLDSASAQEMHRLLQQLIADFQQTFVIVTHNNDLANICNRVLEMRDGRFLD